MQCTAGWNYWQMGQLFENKLLRTNSMRTFFILLGALLLMGEINGCSAKKANPLPFEGKKVDPLPFEKRTPGNPWTNTYALHFDIDYKVVEQGATYQYIPKGEHWVHGLGGGRGGYGLFDELIMDFGFKDGRKFYEVIDLRALMAAMLERYSIFDLAKTKFGGVAEFEIRIDQKRLTIDYQITLIESEKPYIRKYYEYPVFEKAFTEAGLSGATVQSDVQTAGALPGNPDLNICGISFVLDSEVLANGSYSYSPEGTRVMQIADGGRFGYQKVGELDLDFTLKDGRRIRQQIDMRPLIAKVRTHPQLIDLAASKFGGYADLMVSINKDGLTVDYRLLERREKSTLREMIWEETYQKRKDRPRIDYRLIEDLTADSSQYREHLYRVFERKFAE